jgi:hypothetical protein
MRYGLIKTPRDAVLAAQQWLGHSADSKIVCFLERPENMGRPLEFVLRALSVHLEDESYRFSERMQRDATGHKIGLFLPLPHGVLNYFRNITCATAVDVLSASGHPLPPPLAHSGIAVTTGFRATRALISDYDVIVIELFKLLNGGWVGSPINVDLLAPQLLKSQARILAHKRPHKHGTDVPVNSDVVTRIEAL